MFLDNFGAIKVLWIDIEVALIIVSCPAMIRLYEPSPHWDTTWALRFDLAFCYCDLVLRFAAAFWFCVLLIEDNIQCAGSDTRPPMLDRTDFASWQQRIRLYCQGKENGVNILKSIDEGPYQMGTVREPLAEGTKGPPHLGPERPPVYYDLSLEKKIDTMLTSGPQIYYFKGYPRTSTLSSIITPMLKTFGTMSRCSWKGPN
nr:integrase, catalytic region, zinc finger, CCHC-type, peptidase aspartic, catalytic [Tanacetum cinerariifolium]